MFIIPVGATSIQIKEVMPSRNFMGKTDIRTCVSVCLDSRHCIKIWFSGTLGFARFALIVWSGRGKNSENQVWIMSIFEVLITLNSGLQVYLIFTEGKVSTGISWRNLAVQHINAFSAAKLARTVWIYSSFWQVSVRLVQHFWWIMFTFICPTCDAEFSENGSIPVEFLLFIFICKFLRWW